MKPKIPKRLVSKDIEMPKVTLNIRASAGTPYTRKLWTGLWRKLITEAREEATQRAQDEAQND